jgi:isocitrate dehydrogenase
MYWAQALANQTKDNDLHIQFSRIAKNFEANETKINDELISVQGKSMEINGYYLPSKELTEKAMRPSETFNTLLSNIN